MKKTSKIITMIGSIITIFLMFIIMLGMWMIILDMQGIGDYNKFFGVVITAIVLVIAMILPLLAGIFVLLKNKKFRLTGYILAMLSGLLTLIIVGIVSTFGFITVFVILTIVVGITTATGGILGIVFDRK
ncbi:hypothetical protein [Spiroplasma alleghenense]|uniref:Uncharacterized protein n=1 Tax=Spiroplasma alleghenense TaxID=216931 RepID=A0A345Z2F9_9MOLU|nr:hypothetical protein [Spiroplasma alleghenense]AXK50788.1 hypothetical protein SALLE_v1c01120 [Spiroplasma alleghenense]